ncbi:MAG: phosphate ABC transporter substrate-binding protein [Ruminococcaceae bacterium]|nr:phosphate ABC transporter substrate-binding protein [Oscillospiraceae bacterium]
MKKILTFALALLMTAGTFGCADNKEKAGNTDPAGTGNPPEVQGEEQASDDEAEGTFKFTVDNYPKMGGSLANLPLGEAVTATVLGIDRKTASSMITFEGSTTDNYEALVDGTFDILLAYEMGEDAIKYCEEKGVELEMTPIGADALVFICSLENTVESLTDEQIREIYKGNITNWSMVGGDDHPIIAYQRNKDSGSQTLFDKIINLGDELMDAPEETRIGSMIGLLEAVADYDNSKDALGYTVYYYLTNMEQDKLSTSKLLSVDGIAPTNESIASGKYPYVNDFYVVIRKDAPENSPERILYNWIISDQGKELARRENYVVK